MNFIHLFSEVPPWHWFAHLFVVADVCLGKWAEMGAGSKGGREERKVFF